MLPLFRFPAPAQLSGGLEGTDFPFAGFAGMLVVALALPTLSKQAVITLTFLFAVCMLRFQRRSDTLEHGLGAAGRIASRGV